MHMSNIRNAISSIRNNCKISKNTQSLLQIRLCVKIMKYSNMFTNTTLTRTLSPLRLLRIFALAAATMLLAVLLHLLIFHLLTASDVPAVTEAPNAIAPPRKDTQYKIKHVETCPKVGFFFKREGSANSLFPDACYLCFCQGDHTAVCWKRDNRRCNEESFQYHAVGKRQKRSPGFTDLFFRDASRDFFNKNTKTQCKPYESSFSDDCPPADWCVGCTVCDCDSNGRWDCHLLSFCPEGKKKSGKNKNKKQPELPDEWLEFVKKTKEKTHRGGKSSKKDKLRSKQKPKQKPKPKPKNNKIPKPKVKGKPVQRGGKKPTPPKRIVKKNVPFKPGMMQKPGKMKAPIKYRKIAHNKPNSSKMIKKNIATHKPIQIKKKPNKNKKYSEAELAHSMMKKIMQNLRKHVSAKMKNLPETVKQSSAEVKSQKAKAKVNQTINKSKTIKKRQVTKTNLKPPLKKAREPMKKPVYEAKGKTTKKPGNYVRNKRDVTMSSNTEVSTEATQDNSAQSTNTTIPLNVLPVTRDPYVLDSDIDNFIYPLGASATLPDKAYYKYTIGNEKSRSPISNIDEPIPTTTHLNQTETAFNLISPQLAPNVPTTKRQVQDTEVNQSINLTEINPEENELKYSKWYNIKILKEKTLIADSDIKHKSLFKLMPPTDKTIVLENKIRNHGMKVERLLSHNKSNRVKFLNHSNCKFKNCKINNSIDIHTNHQPTSIKADLRGYLKKFFNYHPKNKTSYHPKRRRKLSVLKYLKGIFNKIFKGNKTPVRMNRRQLIDTLCENFGPCLKMTKKDKVLLNTKIAELNRETGKILKTVKIIKGLLRLLEVPNSNNSNISKQEHVRNDLQTLSHVLKGRYDIVNFTLSSTQKTQIQYIKRCMEDFIKLVSNFASLLNAIIAILTTEGNNRLRSKANNYFVHKDLSQHDPFQSLKNLLLRYNLIQNTFMKQMYEQLNSFENKINVKPKVSEVKDLDFNNSVAIENISRNIIDNLRKLKRLAQTASYRGRGTGRTKRNIAREDDAIEYLLMMMEYLMKQNHPLDAEPVNDGIDLLIDAIKNAPDIKPIKKKVLENTPTVISYVTSTSTESLNLPLRTAGAEESQSEDDSPSESDRTSASEDVVKSKPKANARKLNENKKFANILDDEKELEDKLQFDRKVEPDKADEITEMSFFSKFEKEDKIIEESESVYQTTITTTTVPLETETNDKIETNYVNVDKIPVAETSSSVKLVEDTEPVGKKIEVFTGDTDDESILPITVTTESKSPTTLSTEHRTGRLETQKSKLKMKNLQTYDIDNDAKRSRIKWIEENFGKESEKGYVDLDENNSTLDKPPVTAETKTKDAKTLDKIDVTGGTKEKGEMRARNGEIEKYDVTEKKKTTTKLSTEEIMFRKQMELLNSLDYGTERAEVFEADVKDNVDERYSGDSFPSYFV